MIRPGARRQYARSLLGALCAALALVSSAAGQEHQGKVEGVEFIVRDVWPDRAVRGYQPLFVDLVNRSDTRRVARVAAISDYLYGTSSQRTVELEPGQRVSFELLLPTFYIPQESARVSSHSYHFECRVRGEREVRYSLGASENFSAGVKPVMVFSGSRPAAGATEQWSTELSTDQLAPNGWGGGGATINDVQISGTTLDLLSAHHESYTGLSAVVLDTSRGLPPADRLRPLLTYARLGGMLCLFGRDARLAASGEPELAAWMEERFLFDGATTEGVPVFACGLGKLVVGDSATLFGELEQTAVLKDLLSTNEPLVPSQVTRDIRTVEIPGLGRLPYRTFVVLLILFAILIGPVNFIFVRRAGKPALLLLTIPAIALVTSLLLLAYGIFYQGIDTKSSSVSVALLDQREARVDVVEERRAFIGMARAPGLRPGPGTAVFPVNTFSERPRFELRSGEDRILGGTFMPVRELSHLRILSERAARERLVIERDGDSYAVENGFAQDVGGVLLRDGAGEYYYYESRISGGERVKLARADFRTVDDYRDRWRGEFGDGATVSLDVLWPGSYSLELAESTFTDACGLSLTELDGAHGVIGVFDPEEVR